MIGEAKFGNIRVFPLALILGKLVQRSLRRKACISSKK